MRVSAGIVMLSLLGRAAGFAGITTRAHTARLRQHANAARHCSTEAVRRAANWQQIAATTTTVRGGGRVLKASEESAAAPSSSSRPPLDVKSVGR